jgi:hypothetical protein
LLSSSTDGLGIKPPVDEAGRQAPYEGHIPSEEFMGDTNAHLERIGAVSTNAPYGSLSLGNATGNNRADAISKAFINFIQHSNIPQDRQISLTKQMDAIQGAFQHISEVSSESAIQPGINGLLESMFSIYTETISAQAETSLASPSSNRDREYQDMVDLASNKPWLQAYLTKISSDLPLFPKKIGEFIVGVLREAKGSLAPNELETMIKFFTYIAHGQSAEIQAYLNSRVPNGPIKSLLTSLASNPKIRTWLTAPTPPPTAISASASAPPTASSASFAAPISTLPGGMPLPSSSPPPPPLSSSPPPPSLLGGEGFPL